MTSHSLLTQDKHALKTLNNLLLIPALQTVLNLCQCLKTGLHGVNYPFIIHLGFHVL